MTSIFVRHVARSFLAPDGQRLEVLRDVCFEARAGGLVAIVGVSGCGKSTLLTLLAGLEAPSGGEIVFDGPTAVSGGGARANIGYVFQQPRLLPWRTVRGNVELPLETAGWPKADRAARAREHLSRVGLAEYEEYYPHQISGGMQQRVALARALVVDPGVLLMDEPFSALDAMTARQMRDELVRLWLDTRKTIIFVTHDIAEAVTLAETVVVVTPKPARTFREVRVDLPYPRQFDDLRLFELQKQLTRDFMAMIEGWDEASTAD